MFRKRGRPKKWKNGFRLTSLIIPKESEELWKKAVEIGLKEGDTLGETVTKALADYLKVHYPGNPQIPFQPTEAKVKEYLLERKKARIRALLKKVWADQGGWVFEVEKLFKDLKRLGSMDMELEDLVARLTEMALEVEARRRRH